MPDTQISPAFGGPHIGLGMTVRLAAHSEQFGRWPSLVVDTGVLSFQVDLHPALTAGQARAVVRELAVAVAEWDQAVTEAAS